MKLWPIDLNDIGFSNGDGNIKPSFQLLEIASAEK
jgi:hypothetical protein